MAPQLSSPPESLPIDPFADSACQVLLFPARSPADIQNDPPARSASRPSVGSRARLRSRVIRQVVVLEVAGRFSDVAQDLDLAMQLALAEEPRGVVCDLSSVLGEVEPLVVEALAMAGSHVRDWPGIPVGVVCPDPLVREALIAAPLGRHLIVAQSLFCAVSEVLATSVPTVERVRLAPHPTAPRAARSFVTRTLLDWQLGSVVSCASQVASELVVSSLNAGADLDLSVSWNLGAVRLAVRASSAGRPGRRSSGFDHHGQGLIVLAGLSRAVGVMPTVNGGRIDWAVIDAPRPSSSAGHHRRAGDRPEPLSPNDRCAAAQQIPSRINEGGQR